MSVAKRTLLLLDDDPVLAMMFQSQASDAENSVTIADNTDDALRVVRRGAVSACMVDLGVFYGNRKFSDTAGIDFIAQARRQVHDGMPILVHSGSRSASVVLPCFEAGCDDFVSKDEGLARAVLRLKHLIRDASMSPGSMRLRRHAAIEVLRSMASRQSS